MIFQNIAEISDIDLLVKKSHERPQIIFKHSTVCPISRISYEKMQAEYPLTDEAADLYYVGVIEQRPLSNHIAETLRVKHESPQLIVIQNGKAIYDESHLMINPKILKEILA